MNAQNEVYNYFTINVSRHGRHFFATAPHSLRSRGEADDAFKELDARFPASDGFSIVLSGHVEYSRRLQFSAGA